MRPSSTKRHQSGFTLLELLTALGIFLVISGAAFTLLGTSQKRYQSDSQILNTFQEARLGMDQMVRDINDSGYPPQNYFLTQNLTNAKLYATSPFASSPPGLTCYVSNGCLSPNEFDLIVETNIDPQDPASTVSWIRYCLGCVSGGNPTTLYRGISRVVPGPSSDPATDPGLSAMMTPYVQNVMNGAPTAQLQAIYPAIFPSGTPVPIFTYTCDTSTGPQSCVTVSGTPPNIRGVAITLIVMAPVPDGQTGQPRLVQLNGRGRRINPNQ
jgi:prepilin-type N-terminal cleavage/methylation domain-containing protein